MSCQGANSFPLDFLELLPFWKVYGCQESGQEILEFVFPSTVWGKSITSIHLRIKIQANKKAK